MSRCAYCNVSFQTNSAFERHMSRQTGCISQEKMHDMISSLQKKVEDLNHQSIKSFKVDITQLYEAIKDKDNTIITLKTE